MGANHWNLQLKFLISTITTTCRRVWGSEVGKVLRCLPFTTCSSCGVRRHSFIISHPSIHTDIRHINKFDSLYSCINYRAGKIVLKFGERETTTILTVTQIRIVCWRFFGRIGLPFFLEKCGYKQVSIQVLAYFLKIFAHPSFKLISNQQFF